MELEQAEKDLLAMYDDLFVLMNTWLERGMSPPAMGAAMLMTAMRLYRTTLNDEEYTKFIDFIHESRDRVQKFDFEAAARALN